MDEEFKNFLLRSNVKEQSIEKLIDEEFFTVEEINSCTQELLKACGLTGGQVLKIKAASAEFCKKLAENNMEGSTNKAPRAFSSPSPSSSSTPLSKSPSSPACSASSSPSSPEPAFAKFGSSTPKSSGTGSSSWLVNYQLPCAFSPAVTEALVNKTLTGDRRNELTRDICSSIRVHTMYPTKAEREHVAFQLIKMFPFLADAIGTGIGSWGTAFKYRFKNLRKTGKKGEGKSSLKNATEKVNLPRGKKRQIEESFSLPEGETEETIKEHMKAMKREMGRSTNKNVAMINELMALTHGYRRDLMLKELIPVRQIVEDFPALKTASGIKAEFGRILDRVKPVQEMTNTFKQHWGKKIIKFARSSQLVAVKNIMASVEEAILSNPSRKDGIEEAAAVILLPQLLKEKGGDPEDVIKICTEEDSLDKEIRESKFPRIIGSGEFWCMDPICIAVEGVEVLTLGSGTSLTIVLGLLQATYYVFNIQYPSKAANVHLFCETLLGFHNEAKKRVALNKFMSALS